MDSFNAIRVLKVTNFRNLWLSQIISQTAINLLIFSQLLRIFDLTRSNISTSILVLSVGIPNLLFASFAGVLVDFWDKKLVMFIFQFLRLFLVLSFVVFPDSPIWIYFLIFLISCITQFWYPAEVSFLPKIISGPMLLAANSIYTLTFFVTVILGNILAGPLLLILDTNQLFYVIAGAFLVSIVFVSKLPGQKVHQIFVKKHEWFSTVLLRKIRSEMFEGIKYIRRNKLLSQAICYLALSQALITTLGALAPGFAVKILQIRAVDSSLWILAPAALGMVVGAFIISQYFLNISRQLMIKYGLFACGITLVLFSLVKHFSDVVGLPLHLLAVVILVFLGFGNSLLDIPANTNLQEHSGDEVRSRIYGILTALVGAAGIFPVLFAGIFSDWWGVEKVVFGLGIFVLLISLFNKNK